MKKLVFLGLSLLVLGGIFTGIYLIRDVGAGIDRPELGDEPDMPDFVKYKTNKEEFMTRRAENIAMMRGVEKDRPFDPQLRIAGIKELEKQEESRGAMRDSLQKNELLAGWREIGPNPIPNGQVGSGAQLPVSGRTIAIKVHPTNPNIVYAGTAQGGLYRTTDGGINWTPMLDNALSLAIGSIAIAPSQPDTIYVGTGEANFSADSFFGVGIYRIDNASSSSPIITGPLNKDASNADVFTGRGIGAIAVHPTDPNTIFVGTASGVGGISGSANPTLPNRGVYRSTNAGSANPTFTKLTGLAANLNASVRDLAIDPLNPNLLVVNVIANGGGIYTSNDALAAAPTFTQRVTFTSTSTSELTAEFAVQHASGAANPTFYAATGNLGGRILISTDGGVTWTQQIDNNFCTPQCFYDIAVDVDPNDPTRLYVGGAPALPFGISTNSGVSFVSSSNGLHADSHAIAVAPSQPTTIYFGSDGGIYKSIDSGANWSSLNNTTFRATQFMSIAVHPTDPNFTIGGTQDNGTNMYRPDATWNRVDFGDGGYSLIDQSATTTTLVNMYHTYFNASNLQGYGFTSNGATPAEGTWAFRGCQATNATTNGITCNTAAVLFYAPLEQGPGTPNTTYYGTDRLYRSSDTGLTHTVVSQNPIVTGFPISAIGISPRNDNVRIVGLTNGAIWGTSTGSATLVDLDPSNAVPNNYVGRSVIDPTNENTAYVTLSAFGVVNVWKTTNVNSLSDNVAPTWTAAAGTGANSLPRVPVNAFVVDPVNSNRLYAGTDIGVYISVDGGANWIPFGTGLPRVAVFDMAFTADRNLRIATHGRGMWQIPALAPTTTAATVAGTVINGNSGIPRAIVVLTDDQGVSRRVTTSSLGKFSFDGVPVGRSYTITVIAKGYQFQPQTVSVSDDVRDLVITTSSPSFAGKQ